MMSATLLLAKSFPWWAILLSLPPQATIDRFSKHELAVTTGDGIVRTYQYRLFSPKGADTNERIPLIVWLHGYGVKEFSQVGYGHLRHLQYLFPSAELMDESGFYVLALQCPQDQRSFYSHTSSVDDNVFHPGDAVVQVIESLFREHPIDPDRVTLVGISGGASDAIKMSVRHPNMFAAVAAFGMPGADQDDLVKLDSSLWAFHVTEDVDVPLDGAISAVETVRGAGGLAEITFIPGNAHDIAWIGAFEDNDVRGWLLSQNRRGGGRAPGAAPLFSQWTSMTILLSSAAMAFLGFVVIRRQRRSITAAGNIVHG